MAYQNLKFHLSNLLLIVCVLLLSLPHITGKSLRFFNTKHNSSPAKNTLKTIQDIDDYGEKVDCVDIYSQPALSHPLLRNHKIEVNPAAPATTVEQSKLPLAELIQPWHKNGKCSEGTVPITRRRQLQDTPPSNTSSSRSIQAPHTEAAKVSISSSAIGGRLHGGSGLLSIWAPDVARPADWSMSSVLVSISPGVYFSAGWIVYPERYGDSKPRLFIFWTIDSNLNDCWDLDCDGFVQVNNKLALGSPLEMVSTIGGPKQVFRATIHQAAVTKHWWVRIGENAIGYWPASLIPAGIIKNGARLIEWGGVVSDSIGKGNHTETDMGNGLFPNSDNASYMCQLRYFDESLKAHIPESSSLKLLVTNPKCYNAKIAPTITKERGPCFYYGGSGLNPECP